MNSDIYAAGLAITLGVGTIIAATYYGGKGVGKFFEQIEHDNAVRAAQKELNLTQASENAGNTYGIKVVSTSYMMGGKEVEGTEYRNVPIAELKAEQVKIVNDLKAEPVGYDGYGCFVGGLICLVGSAAIVIKTGEFIADNIIDPVGEFLVNGEEAVRGWFKKKPKSTEIQGPGVN